MKLRQLELENYRNYQQVALEFGDGVQIFLGENAQGKTNLMEAIYVLAMTKSHRAGNDRELIGWDQEQATIKGLVEKKTSNFPLELRFTRKGKMAKVNHLEQKKLSTYLGQLNVILFAPEDLFLVKGSPAIRRKFIDMELGQMNPVYLHELVDYQRVVKQRNSYLKQLYYKKASDLIYLEVLTEQLASIAATILSYRLSFIQQVEALAQPIHQQLSHGRESLTITYQSTLELDASMTVEEIYELLMQQFQKIQKREIEQSSTLIGPHRDDMNFYLNGKDVQVYGSQGQQRSTVLSLKLAEIELMKLIIGEYPILLLDDVLSELDDERQTHLIKAIENKVQTFLTTTSLDGIQQQFINPPNVFHIHQGNIIDPT